MKGLYFLITTVLVITIINHFKLNSIMSKQDQINASLSELNDATNSIAAKIQKLIDGQSAGDEVSQDSLDQLQAVADQLKAMGSDESNPIPVEPTA